jgi:hypothetical protein
MRKTVLLSIALFLALFITAPLSAQVQIGGHVYVPSTTDSTNGLTVITFTADGDCDIITPVNCTLTNFAGNPDISSPYTGTLVIGDPNGFLTTQRNIIAPDSPGRTFIIINDTSFNLNLTDASLSSEVLIISSQTGYGVNNGNQWGEPLTPCPASPASTPSGYLLEFTTVCGISPLSDSVTQNNVVNSNEDIMVNESDAQIPANMVSSASALCSGVSLSLSGYAYHCAYVDQSDFSITGINTDATNSYSNPSGSFGSASLKFDGVTGCTNIGGSNTQGANVIFAKFCPAVPGINDAGLILPLVSTSVSTAPVCPNGLGGTLTNSGCLSVGLSTATNCTSATEPSVCGSAQAGIVTFGANSLLALSQEVDTTAVHAGSQISVVFDQSAGSRLGVTCQVAGSNAPIAIVQSRTVGANFVFVIFGLPPLTNVACFDYIIVN